MAKPNYAHQKKQREQAAKKKREDKQQRRQQKKDEVPAPSGEMPGSTSVETAMQRPC